MCTKTKAKVLLITFNFLFWGAGLAMLGFGIWMKVDPESVTKYLAFLTETDPLVSYVAILFIAIGAFTVFVGFVGLCGAFNEKKPMLILYSCILIIFMVAELSAVVTLIVYRNKVDETLREEHLKKMLGNDQLFKDATESIWNHVQSTLDCCGIFGFSDYRNSTWWNSVKIERNLSVGETAVPNSCCVLAEEGRGSSSFSELKNGAECRKDAMNEVKTSEYLHVDGCLKAVLGWIKVHTLAMVILAVGIFAFELFGAIAACFLCLLLNRESSTKEDH